MDTRTKNDQESPQVGFVPATVSSATFGLTSSLLSSQRSVITKQSTTVQGSSSLKEGANKNRKSANEMTSTAPGGESGEVRDGASPVAGEGEMSTEVPKVSVRINGSQKKVGTSVDSKRSNTTTGIYDTRTKKATFAELAAKLPKKIREQEIKGWTVVVSLLEPSQTGTYVKYPYLE